MSRNGRLPGFVTEDPVRLDRRLLLKRTTSRCSVCHRPCPAEVILTSDSPAKVFLSRSCPEHGKAETCIASDARFYWLAKGKPENADDCSGGGSCCNASGTAAGTLGQNATGRRNGPFETLSTCLAQIEIVRSCNLSCPTCYADSPLGWGEKTDAVPLDNLKKRIQGVIDRKGRIEILQLSGGEPTLHPGFFELMDWIQANCGIDYLLLNTNGVRIATDEPFAKQLAQRCGRGRFQLYLQFDGTQEAGQHSLRGADLRSIRRQAIDRCGEMPLPVTLAMTVTHDNLPFLWDAIDFGLRFPHIRGISFQPMFRSGRVPPAFRDLPNAGRKIESASRSLQPEKKISGGRNAEQERAVRKLDCSLNTADIILAAVGKSSGRLHFEDFTPLPCGDPNCATIGYLLRINNQIRSISEFIDFTRVQSFLRDKIRYRLEDLVQCGCESEPLGSLLKSLELDESNTFRLFIKPFMDAWSWDEDRIDRCCTHVIRPDGKLDSFCRYYSGFE